ncbi:putative senescence regulator S40 [Helianthus annuus]|uniref:Senescence regulator S40 n=1 Tax=Helianthus annuus TaxID=4232 RepID=A0A9K3HC63_HELAN|nr:uncharacterized protein LOC110910950 [Helianthus annuus]KAF5773079.1 putative senescence regulator S40 [Helianthus annuus]KAJ0476622.1 putative senescence regulator S40 [Helianthus annuus]KAJ0480880.1 putative senescence regulator S40 [Helianthus annuus]KAJ0497439.1 putative senescence regulator S40 [Helianthus annuus]KAJ0663455.1 putative senescence regulator S40 [Helianthus annuus]
MATIYSGHRHHHHRNPIDDEDSDNFDSYNTNNSDEDHEPINPEKPILKPTIITKKLQQKPHQKTTPVAGKSMPVNIPDWSKILKESDQLRSDDEDEWLLPPHEYLARIRGISFSVHEGVGRTLKGRDLSRLRNAIWKQTGVELD